LKRTILEIPDLVFPPMTLSEYEQQNPDSGPRITLPGLETQCQAYERDEGGYDRYYAPSCSLVSYGIQNERWDCICGGTSLLVYAWNAAFYRSPFDYASLEASLRNNWRFLIAFRSRQLSTLNGNGNDQPEIERLFNDLTSVLSSGRARAQVSAAKALHVIAPSFFSMWDNSIASRVYNCPYDGEPGLAYVAFCERIRGRVASVQADWDSLPPGHWLRRKLLLKRIDEFNFMSRPPRRAQPS
jgi:hypothetical protein